MPKSKIAQILTFFYSLSPLPTTNSLFSSLAFLFRKAKTVDFDEYLGQFFSEEKEKVVACEN
jgi:hypothetical protein